jgi:hypothetical protein
MAQAGAILIKRGIRPENSPTNPFLATMFFIITQVDIAKALKFYDFHISKVVSAFVFLRHQMVKLQ